MLDENREVKPYNCERAYADTDAAIRNVATDFSLSDPDRDKALTNIQSLVHGDAKADNTYSLEFKAVLQDIADREAKYAKAAGASRPNGSTANHRVVGIEIAWRGDSILFPSQASVWDRKLAAETVSIGAVHELFAFLNQRYLDYSCRGSQPTTAPCDRVHLLTIGHSFGALIAGIGDRP